MLTLLVVSAVGADRPGIVFELSKTVRESGCMLKDSRMAVLGSEFSVQFLVTGNWNAVAKLEQSLPRTTARLELELTLRRTQEREHAINLIPYSVEVISMERPGVVEDITEFFARREIGIEDVFTSCFAAPHTQAPMYSVHMTIGVPGETPIATLRNEFLELCDDLNLDAVLTAFK
jgi:glycine cleavage system transcriptional repressor